MGAPCDCGITLPVIKRIWGRDSQLIQTPQGQARYVVLIAEDFLSIAPLRDMRLRYYRDPLACLEVACTASLTAEQRQQLATKVQELLGFECPVQLLEVPSIDWGATDKRLGFSVVDSLAPPV